MSFNTPTPVQVVFKQGSATSITTTAVATTTGNLLVAVVTCFSNRIGAVTDSNGNTWATAVASTGTTEGWAAMFYVNNATGGAGHTFTFTPTSSDFCCLVVFEIQGQDTGSVLGSTSATSASSTTHSSGNITSGLTNEIFIGGGAVGRAAELTPVGPSGWYVSLALPGNTFEGGSFGFRVVGPGVTDQYTYTTSSANRETSVIAGFKGTGSGGATETAVPFVGIFG